MKSKLFALGAIKFVMKPRNYLSHNTKSKSGFHHLFVIFEFIYKLINIPILPVHCDLVKPDFGTLHAIWLGLSLGCTLVVQLYTVHTSATNPTNADKPRN